jgi:His-Xaa-Ser system radical SAM maturase HxsB
VERRSLTLRQQDIAADTLGFFRWGHIGGKILLTNDASEWALLTEAEFDDLLAGRVAEGHPRFEEFQRLGFVRDGLDLDALATRIAQRNRHVRRGPHVHVLTLTQRRGSASANGQADEAPAADMSSETAESIVELALQGTSPSLSFELRGQGGEPLLNFDVLRHLVEFARSRNERAAGKTLRFVLASNFTAMTEEIAEWLIANDVLVCTTLDGPAALHDQNRQSLGGSEHADVVRWIEYFNRRYAELGRDPRQWHVDALARVTKRSLGAWREIVDEYAARGMRSLHLRPLDSSRRDPGTWQAIGYTAEEYLDFYRNVLGHVLDLNRRGVDLTERLAAVLATKILTAEEPGIVDLQSPYGAGTGQIAYDVDGRVFPCDEAREVDASGDPIFELGHVRNLNVQGIARHPTVRAIAAASLLDVQPMCADCWNKPFCGFSPVRNFVAQGDLFGLRPACFECREHMAVSTRLFELLADENDSATTEILKRWATARSPHAVDARVAKEAP